MSAEAGSTTVLLVGALLVRMVLTGDYLRYVRSGMGPWLVVAGVLLVGLGATGLVTAVRRRTAAVPAQDGHEETDAHDGHAHGAQRVGWLLLGPVLALLLVTPPALGSFGVDRTAAGAVQVRAGGAVFAALPAGGGPTALTLAEFDQRAADRAGASLGRAPVRLTGFVAAPGDDGGVRIARYQIACCAADAVAAVVRLVGLPTTPARESWLTVVGTYRGSGPDGVPELSVTGSDQVPPPVDPYES